MTWLIWLFSIQHLRAFILVVKQWNKYEPGHQKMCLMSYVNNKGTDQPAHPCGLISAFIVLCLDSMTSLDSIAEISRL